MELSEARQILEVDEHAEWAAIRLRYKKLALKLHPDKNPNDPGAPDAFARLRVAYDALEKAHLSTERAALAEEEEAEKRSAATWHEERMRARSAVNEALRAAAEEARLAMFEQQRRRARANAVPPKPAVTAVDETSVTVTWEPPDEHLFGAVSVYELQFCIVRCADGPQTAWAYVWQTASAALPQRTARKKNLAAGHGYVFRVRAQAAKDGLWSQFSPPTSPATPGEPVEDMARPESIRPMPLAARTGQDACQIVANRCRLPPERAQSGGWELQYRARRGLWMATSAPDADGGGGEGGGGGSTELSAEQHALDGLHERATFLLRARARALPAGVWSCWSEEVGPIGVRPPDGSRPRSSGVMRSVGKALLAAGLRSSAKPAGSDGRKRFADGSTFSGALLCGLAHGEGELRLASGAVCAGRFELDVLHGGQGTMVEADGATRYSGQWQYGARHGRGEQVWGGDVGPFERYSGGWEDGLFSGEGSLTLRTGETYSGGWLAGARSGQGEARVPKTGEWYRGGWDKDAYSGKGTGRFIYPDRSVYEGETLNGARHGEGVLVVPPCEKEGAALPGWTYKGRHRDNEADGRGELLFADGRCHTGLFRAGRKHGKGRFVWPGGDYTDGTWEQGELVGDCAARVSYANGDVYEGGMRAGSQHGEGTYTRKSGHTYAGQWQAGMRHGHGRSTAPNGDWYEGGWQRDEQHGKGKGRRSFPAGVYVGALLNGQLTGKGTFAWHDGRKYEVRPHAHAHAPRPAPCPPLGAKGRAAQGGARARQQALRGRSARPAPPRRSAALPLLPPVRAQGEWSSGTQSGHGSFTDCDGDRYTGGFAQGQFHGQGRLHEASGDYFHGEFSHGEKVGKGKARITYASGDVYEGEVVGSVKAGHGTYTWRASGDKYTGGWAADRQHGKGRLTKGNGGVQEGTWNEGELMLGA